MSDEMQAERFQALTEAAREAVRREAPGIEAALMRILEALDMKESECTCCHFRVKQSYRDTQLADLVRGTRGKLRRWEEEAGGRKKL